MKKDVYDYLTYGRSTGKLIYKPHIEILLDLHRIFHVYILGIVSPLHHSDIIIHVIVLVWVVIIFFDKTTSNHQPVRFINDYYLVQLISLFRFILAISDHNLINC